MRHGTRRTLLSAPLLAACVLTACSGSPDTAEPEQASPLTEYFGALYGGDLSPEDQQKMFAEQNKRSEELVAKCMKEEGFEYKPNTAASAVLAGREDWDVDSRDFISQYGYAVVEQPDQEEGGGGAAEEYEDPNADYVASLSESEQKAFQEALSGPQRSEEEMGTLKEGEQEWDWATAGCTGKAQHEMTRDDPLQSDEHKGLLEAVNAFYEEQTTWPELAELNSAWSTCMADQGHPGFAAQTDAAQSLYDEYAELQESAGAAGEVDEAALDALGKKEVELALADFDCREKIDYQPKHEKITFEKEQQFVDDHKAELDAMKADAEQGR